MHKKPAKKKGTGKRLQSLRKYIFICAMLLYPLILFAIFYVGVNFNSIIMAFQKFNINGSKVFNGFENFRVFFNNAFVKQTVLKTGVINSIVVWILSFIISMPLYILFSYLLFKRVRGHAVYKFLYMLPTIISGMVYLLVFKQFVGDGLPKFMVNLGYEGFPNLLSNVNTAFGTCLFYSIWTSFSISLITYPNAMNGIDQGVLESAQIDGVSNMYQELYYIILPLIYPTISTFIIMGVAGIFGASLPLIGLYGYNAPGKVYTVNYYYTIQVLTATNNLKYPELAAGGLILTAIIAPLTMLIKQLLEKISPVRDAI